MDVTVLEDLTKWDKTLVKGEKVHLEGKSAFTYVKERDLTKFGSNDRRLERQRQYLNGFIKAARDNAAEDSDMAVNLFKAISGKMVTNISIDEISYLAPEIIDYSFDATDFMMIDGETKKTGEFEEFHVDQDDLYRTIIEVFYEKVENVD